MTNSPLYLAYLCNHFPDESLMVNCVHFVMMEIDPHHPDDHGIVVFSSITDGGLYRPQHEAFRFFPGEAECPEFVYLTWDL